MKRALFTVAIFLGLAGAAMATVNLTANITIPNITRWKIDQIVEDRDATPPKLVLKFQFLSAGGVAYGPPNCHGECLWHIQVTDSSGAVIDANPSPTGYYDRVAISPTGGPTGAYSAITTAMDSAGGTRANRRAAAEQACLAVGVCGAGLGGSTLR